MSIYSRCQQAGLGLGSAIVGIAGLSVSAEAATIFSRAIGDFQVDFDQPALAGGLLTSSDTFTLTENGPAIATGGANALITSPPGENAELDLFVASDVIANGRGLFGLADSEASANGWFLVGAGETFSFDFSLYLEAVTSVDNPIAESALAAIDFTFSLFSQALEPDIGLPSDLEPELANPSFLSGLQFSALLETPGENEISGPFIGEGFELFPNVPQFVGVDDIEPQEGVIVDLRGRYEKTFDQATLIQINQAHLRGVAIAQTPAPSLLWGILSLGIIGVVRQVKRPGAIADRYSNPQ